MYRYCRAAQNRIGHPFLLPGKKAVDIWATAKRGDIFTQLTPCSSFFLNRFVLKMKSAVWLRMFSRKVRELFSTLGLTKVWDMPNRFCADNVRPHLWRRGLTFFRKGCLCLSKAGQCSKKWLGVSSALRVQNRQVLEAERFLLWDCSANSETPNLIFLSSRDPFVDKLIIAWSR